MQLLQPFLRYLHEVGVEVRLTADGIGIVGIGVGVVSGQDLLDATARLHEERAHNPNIRYAVMDLSAISQGQIDTESVRLSAKPADGTPQLTVAIVAPSDVLFGLSRMWEMLAEQTGLATRVVRTRAELITWLQEELAQPVDPFRLSE